MNKPQSNPTRARLQQLQAIPERQRTEEEWDELNELEIMFAAGNRDTGQQAHREGNFDRGSRDQGRRDGNPQQGQGQGQGQGQRNRGDGQGGLGGPGNAGGPGGPGGGGRKGQRKFHKKPKKNLPPR